jgi:hypothetical protein
MRKRLPVGLIVEGNLTKSVTLRLPGFSAEFGPIKASSLRIARRAANFLNAGYGVSAYGDLQGCRLILLRIPDESVSRVVDELCSSELNLKHLIFVFCETWLASGQLSALTSRGAHVATVTQVPSLRRNWFIVEGSQSASKQARRLLEAAGAEVLQLRGETKYLYFTAEVLTTALPGPLYRLAQQTLRESGLSGNHLSTLMEELMLAMFRDFRRGTRSILSGSLQSSATAQIASDYFQLLWKSHPQVAQVLESNLEATQSISPGANPDLRAAFSGSATLK